MQKFFSNKKLIVLLVALILSMGGIAFSVSVRNNKSTPPVIQQFGNDIVGIFGHVVSVPVNGLANGIRVVSDLTNTYEENAKLKKQLDELAQSKVTEQTLKDENKELKSQLKLNGTLTDYTQINAAVMMRTPSSWQNILIINRGETSGIKKNMPVMAGSGIIGRVIEVNKANSKVELISTSNQSSDRFAAQITTKSDKKVNGIITGFDKASGDLVLGQLNTDSEIQKGDKVITSGLGGLTPKGLFIGTVVSVKKDDYGLANSAYIKPATDINNVTVVTVIDREVAGESE